MQIPDSVIRDAATTVFADGAYHRTSLLDRLGAWLLDVLEAVFIRLGPAQASPTVFWVIVVLTSSFVLLVLGRTIYGVRLARTSRVLLRNSGRGSGDPERDWARARELAAGGDYTRAAHALYAALLALIATQDNIELHSSKTIGDYTRELRRRASHALAGFRDFAHAYETVIYGIGFCDRERYERLHGLAARLIQSHV
jgi:hypothetical protein